MAASPSSKMLAMFGAMWLGFITILMFYIISCVHSIQQTQNDVVVTLSKKFSEHSTTTIDTLRQNHKQALQILEAAANKDTEELPNNQQSSTSCPPCVCNCATEIDNSRQQGVGSGLVNTVKVQPQSTASATMVKTALRWMGVDGGKDFFLSVITWDKRARAEKALILEVGSGDGRQAVKTAELGLDIITVDASSANHEFGKNLETDLRAKGNVDGTITWVHSAVSNYTGTARFYADSGMGRLLDNRGKVSDPNNKKWAGNHFEVPVDTLDNILAKHRPGAKPLVFKVDVEGHEYAVLRGAQGLLNGPHRPPIVIIEFNPTMMEWAAGTDATQVLELLASFGYDLYDSRISEPKHKGFQEKYGSFHRPTQFDELVSWFKKSSEFDWWGSWTDIIAIDPNFV